MPKNMLYNNVNPYRSLVAGVNTRIPLDNGSYTTAINFDNAATTPPFLSVIKDVDSFIPWYSSIHRGKGYKSAMSTNLYEEGRQTIKDFVKADHDNDTIVYTKNTTEAINILAYILSQQKNGKDVVLSTWMEHAANDLPWRDKFTVDYIETDGFGRLSIDNLEAKLKKYKDKVRIVTVTGASNVTGYINDIYTIAAMAHRHGAEIHVDGAQLVPHLSVDMKPFGTDSHIDYLSFSAHKMYAPYGSGALIGPKSTFEIGLPYCQGGSAISLVTHDKIWWEEPPHKDEASTPNLLGIAALISSIKTLTSLGMDNIFKHERTLLYYAYEKMKSIPGITFYSHPEIQESIGVIPFNIEGVHHSLMSAILSYEAGIAVRNGFFCAHPYCERLLGYSAQDMDEMMRDPKSIFPGIVRASFGIYNGFNEIDRFIAFLNQVALNKKYYVNKYGNSRSRYNIKNEV